MKGTYYIMNDTHGNGCCCNSKSGNEIKENHTCCSRGCGHHQIEISNEELIFLKQLAQTPFLPLAKFVIKSTKSKHLETVALAPVYLNEKNDTMETVKNNGAVLKSLSEKGLISLDYEEALENGNYQDYLDSELYAYFAETVHQGKDRDGFLFDIPDMELGSIALTAMGREAIKQLK